MYSVGWFLLGLFIVLGSLGNIFTPASDAQTGPGAIVMSLVFLGLGAWLAKYGYKGQ